MSSAPRLASRQEPRGSHTSLLAQDKVPVWSRLPAGKAAALLCVQVKTCELLVTDTRCSSREREKGESCQIQLVSAPGADGGLAQQRVFTNCQFPEYRKQSSED